MPPRPQCTIRPGLPAEGARSDDAARQAYIDLLALAPDHAGALNNLGTLLYETGYVSAARTAYAEAVARHPDDPIGRVNLRDLSLAGGQVDEARLQFEVGIALFSRPWRSPSRTCLLSR